MRTWSSRHGPAGRRRMPTTGGSLGGPDHRPVPRPRRPHGAADDLAQETLLRGFRSLHTLVDPDRFGTWLSGIALRTCRDWLKSRQNAQIPFSVLAADHAII